MTSASVIAWMVLFRAETAALRAEAWQDNIVGGGTLTHLPEPGGMRFTMSCGEAAPWSYPLLTLDADDIPAPHVEGLRFTLRMHDGTGASGAAFKASSAACFAAGMSGT